MISKRSTKPRKLPTQRRSSETVLAILKATARVLSATGYDRMSTNRVAEVAGVSVGSLYQYFPNKEALVAELIDRHREELLGVFRDGLSEVANWPLDVAVRRLVEVTIEAHAREPRLHRVLSDQIPRVGRLADLMNALDVIAAPAARLYLESRKDELRVKNLELATRIVVHTVESLCHRLVVDERAPVEEITPEIADLVMRYLLKEV